MLNVDRSSLRSIEAPEIKSELKLSLPTRARFRSACFMAAAIMVAGLLGADRLVYTHFSERVNTPNPADLDFHARTHAVWDAVRIFGSAGGTVITMLAMLLFHSRSWRAAVVCVASIVVVTTIGFVAQGATGRIRPNHAMIAESPLISPHLQFMPFPQGLLGNTPTCFPSGEATAAFALAAALAAIWPNGRIAFFALAILGAVARLISGSHFLSDVSGGALLGYGLTTPLIPAFASLSARIPPIQELAQTGNFFNIRINGTHKSET